MREFACRKGLYLLAGFLLTFSGCQRVLPEPSSGSISPENPPAATEVQQGLVRWQADGSFTLSDHGKEGVPLTLDGYTGDGGELVREGAKIKAEYLEGSDLPRPVTGIKQLSPPPSWMQYQNRAGETVSAMSLEEKVGQMFFIRCPLQDAAEQISRYHPGGILMFAQDFRGLTAEGVQEKIASYQEAANVPLLIGTDEEGGTVVRVSSNPQLRSSRFLSPQQVFLQGGMSAIISDTEEKSRLLLSLGVNVNLAPVCDVSTSPADFIYSRSWGRNAADTAVYVGVAVDTMRKEGIGCVLKHFPGYGNNLDTHTEIVYDNRPINVFETSDFLPFQEGIRAGAECVLVSHNIVSAMDARYPASLSPEVHRVLRDGLEFQGVIITDDLAMDAVRMYTEGEEAAVQAVAAGNDMLIVTDYAVQIPAVLKAVQDGVLEESLIDKAAIRVLCWKMSLGLDGFPE